MNNVNLTGRLTKDPEQLAVTASGRHVLDLRLAVNRHRRDTVFVDVKCWEGVAEAAADHLAKGSLVGVTGELARDEWTDKATGEARQRYYINARSLDFLDFRVERPAAGHDTPATGASSDAAVEAF
jgi:single stranded DNA-binding protein